MLGKLRNESNQKDPILEHFKLVKEKDIEDTLLNETIIKIFKENKKKLNMSLDDFFKCILNNFMIFL